MIEKRDVDGNDLPVCHITDQIGFVGDRYSTDSGFEFKLGMLIAVCIPSLDEWHTLCDWMETLSCPKLITGEASDI